MRARLKTLGDSRAEKSRAIAAAIAAHPAYAQRDVIALFDPLPSEPDIERLWEKGCRDFCYPRVVGEKIEFVAVHMLEDLAPAAWNPKIREPKIRDERVIAPAEIQLILVPGLAFTRDGRRLGRGGAYYDRLLAGRDPRTIALGVCFDLQLVGDLPCEPHDQRVDAVVTESGTLAR